MTCPNDDVKRGIGQKILPSDWDFEHQRAVGNGKAARGINQVIDSIIGVLPGLKSECRRAGRVISCADIHAAIDVILQDKRTGKRIEPATRDMFVDFKSIIAGMRDGSIKTPTKKKKRYSKVTIDNYEKRALPKLQEFYEAKKHTATWEGINIELYDDFLSWCHEGDLSNNTIGAHIKCWKRAGKIALKFGWHKNNIFENEDFMTLKEETPDIYLDEKKLEKIYRHKLSKGNQDIVRDWAMLDAYLGLRISDLQKVTDSDFAGEFFQFVNQKTGAHVAIPIHSFAREILKKWHGIPPPCKDYIFRENIKKVAKLAGLKDKFVYMATVGGEVKSYEFEEWQCVSPHTFRRSFITNLLKMGIPHAHVMLLAGIKKYETLQRYFKQTNIEVAQDLSEHEFFKSHKNSRINKLISDLSKFTPEEVNSLAALIGCDSKALLLLTKLVS